MSIIFNVDVILQGNDTVKAEFRIGVESGTKIACYSQIWLLCQVSRAQWSLSVADMLTCQSWKSTSDILQH